MIRAKVTLGNGDPLYVLGLGPKNLEKLRSGDPILVNLEDLGVPNAGMILIHYGDTVHATKLRIEKATGIELPIEPFNKDNKDVD